jgi:hypothetical protein
LDSDSLSQEELNEQMLPVKERQRMLAVAFRDCMTTGQSFRDLNDYRRTFFKQVIDMATEVSFHNDLTTVRMTCFKFMRNSVLAAGEGKDSRPVYKYGNEGVLDAGAKLSLFVDPYKLLDSSQGPRHPLVILTFDESHMLTETPRNKSWTVFSELCQVLGELVEEPIFSLFLSTAGKLHLFSPEIRSDPSRRAKNNDLPCLHPVSEISFDDLAYPAMEDEIMLSQVVQTKWISHFGRPLYVHLPSHHRMVSTVTYSLL